MAKKRQTTNPPADLVNAAAKAAGVDPVRLADIARGIADRTINTTDDILRAMQTLNAPSPAGKSVRELTDDELRDEWHEWQQYATQHPDNEAPARMSEVARETIRRQQR